MKMAENIKTTTSIVLITETEESERQSSHVEEDNIPLIQILVKKDIEISGEASVGKFVMKQFEAGLFCGEVVSATENRGRFLYHVVYEDGDEEDMNDREFKEAYELHKIQTNKALKVSVTSMANEDSENDDDKSGGETEGSEYNGSEDDATIPKKKRRRTKRDQYIKEKAKKVEKQNKKEEDAINGKKPVIIDVDALFKSTSKNKRDC
jgi:hypothetical protein